MSEASPRKMPVEHYRSIARLEDHYWWHQARFRLVSEAVARRGRALTELDVADVGCASGGFLRYLARAGCTRIVGFDGDESALAVVAQEGIAARRIDFDHDHDLGGTFDLITALDVLEHLPSEAKLLASILASLRERGLAVFTVPAHPALYSAWDRSLQHFRRYSKEPLVALLEGHGFRVLESSYFFSFAAPMALARRSFGWFDGSGGCEFPAISPGLDRTLAALATLERRVLRAVAMPVGTSLYAVVERS